MVKYLNTMIGFREIPDEISLLINITNCPIHCPDCHSKELWKDIGKDLSQRALERLISENSGISCVCFMGGDASPKTIELLAEVINRKYPNLKVAWYSGKETFPEGLNLEYFDYIKIGPYIKQRGGLDNPNTNQKLYAKYSVVSEISGQNVSYWKDITKKFWKNG